MKKRAVILILAVMFIALCAAALFCACNGTERKITFTIDGETYYETTAKDGAVVIFPEVALKENCEFNGWYLDGVYCKSDRITVDGDMTFEATWRRHHYNIVYVLSGGSNDVRNISRYATGSTMKLYAPTREGYSFAGWYFKEQKIEEITGETLKNSKVESITLFAEWEPLNYGVALDAQGGVLEDKDYYATYGSYAQLPVPERYGYKFAGWYDGQDRITDEKGKSLLRWTYVETVNLTAKWEESVYGTGLIVKPGATGYVLTQAHPQTETVVIPDYVTEIGAYAFKDNTVCKEVVFAEGSKLAVVNEHAFSGSAIQSIVLPSGVVSLGDYAFSSCNELKSVSFAEGSRLNHIGKGVFSYCDSLTSADLPQSVTEIPADAFYGCRSMYVYKLPESVKYVGENAFENCYVLSSLTLPESLVYIGENAFLGCVSLREIYNLSALELTAGDTSYGRVAFNATDIYGNTDATSKVAVTAEGFVFYDGAEGAVLVTATGIEETLILPQSYNGNSYVIGEKAFYYKNYTQVVISGGVTEIGESAFYGCGSLVSVEIGSNVVIISDAAFTRCVSLESVDIPADGALNIIAFRAFEGCTALTSFVVTSNVEFIGQYAFRDCVNLAQVSNLSALNIVAGSEENGGVALYALNVSTSRDAA